MARLRSINPSVDRIWGTKGSFATLFEQYEELSAAARGKRDKIRVRKRILDHCFSGVIGGLSKLYPLFKVIDSSPYDRAMRRIHNYMKESQDFRNDPSNYREIRFPPFSTWMVFTDGVSHSVVSGQHALVTTNACCHSNRSSRTSVTIQSPVRFPALRLPRP